MKTQQNKEVTFDTQCKIMYKWLLAGNGVTTMQDAVSLKKLRISSITKVISMLVNQYLVPIQKEWKKNLNTNRRYMQYSISRKDREDLKDIPLSMVESFYTGNKNVL